MGVTSLLDRIPTRWQAAGVRGLFALPRPVQRLLAGPAVHRDGQRLALEAQLLVRVQAAADQALVQGSPAASRARMRRSMQIVDGPRVDLVDARNLTVPGPAGPVGCRLYVPDGLAVGSPMLVYHHGGGYVLGDLDTHDNLCRFLARYAGIRVLSVDYRLAPEHPAPAAGEDCLAVYRHACSSAAEWGADPDRIAIGGDSAGANLAAVTALAASGAGLPSPAFLLLFYPGTDATVRRRSRDLFGSGLLLTDPQMMWFMDHYVPDAANRADPRVSPLLADNLAELPPTYVATAGFDPLRDEGEAFAAALADAGVAVVCHRQPDLIHGFANLLGLGGRFREAVLEAAAVLRTGLALTVTADRAGAPRSP